MHRQAQSLDNDFLLKELNPFLLCPRAGNFIGHETVPEGSRGDVDPVLTGEFDCKQCQYNALLLCCARLTGVLEIIRDGYTAVWRRFQCQQVLERRDVLFPDDTSCDVGKFLANLEGRESRCRNVEEFLLSFEQLFGSYELRAPFIVRTPLQLE